MTKTKIFTIDYSYEVRMTTSIEVKTNLDEKELEDELYAEHKDTHGDLRERIQNWVECHRERLLEVDDRDYKFKLDTNNFSDINKRNDQIDGIKFMLKE